jgi:hypothetical protein
MRVSNPDINKLELKINDQVVNLTNYTNYSNVQFICRITNKSQESSGALTARKTSISSVASGQTTPGRGKTGTELMFSNTQRFSKSPSSSTLAKGLKGKTIYESDVYASVFTTEKKSNIVIGCQKAVPKYMIMTNLKEFSDIEYFW